MALIHRMTSDGSYWSADISHRQHFGHTHATECLVKALRGPSAGAYFFGWQQRHHFMVT